MALINNQQTDELAQLIDQPQQAKRTFWTSKVFHGYTSKQYQFECRYATVVRFFHKQEEALRETFLQQLGQLFNQPDVDIWFADESGFEGDPHPR